MCKAIIIRVRKTSQAPVQEILSVIVEGLEAGYSDSSIRKHSL